jgi:hypothetical protein
MLLLLLWPLMLLHISCQSRWNVHPSMPLIEEAACSCDELV